MPARPARPFRGIASDAFGTCGLCPCDPCRRSRARRLRCEPRALGGEARVKVAVCDYRAGNIRSVEIALRRLGAEMSDDVAGADLAVLPGVGSARSAMNELRAQGLDVALRERLAGDKPVLGICPGLPLAVGWSGG